MGIAADLCVVQGNRLAAEIEKAVDRLFTNPHQNVTLPRMQPRMFQPRGGTNLHASRRRHIVPVVD
jgi:hypothetical protein